MVNNYTNEKHTASFVKWRGIAASTAILLLPAAAFAVPCIINKATERGGGMLCVVLGIAVLLLCGGAVAFLLALRPRWLHSVSARRLAAFAAVLAALCLAAGLLFVFLPQGFSALAADIVFAVCIAALGVVFISTLTLARRIDRERRAVALSQFLTTSLYRLARVRSRCGGEARDKINAVMASLRSADPHSDFDTAECEDTVFRYIRELERLDNLNDIAAVEPVCDALLGQIARREEICRTIRAAAKMGK